jgi:hypothetical protein
MERESWNERHLTIVAKQLSNSKRVPRNIQLSCAEKANVSQLRLGHLSGSNHFDGGIHRCGHQMTAHHASFSQTPTSTPPSKAALVAMPVAWPDLDGSNRTRQFIHSSSTGSRSCTCTQRGDAGCMFSQQTSRACVCRVSTCHLC